MYTVKILNSFGRYREGDIVEMHYTEFLKHKKDVVVLEFKPFHK